MNFYLEKPFFIGVFQFFFIINSINAQYAFEKHPAPYYEEYGDWVVYDRENNQNKYDCTQTIDDFYGNKDDLTIQLTWFDGDVDFGMIRIFRNKKEIQEIKESGSFSRLTMMDTKVLISDINGDGYKDVKLIQQGTGNGVMGMLVKVLYLFQNKEGGFHKISFDDMTFKKHREERDIDNDGNYEIVTMNLEYIKGHSYWVFNLYEYVDENLKNVNIKKGYPIAIPYTNNRSYKITKDISVSQLKDYEREFPKEYEVN
ncbi:hypothetical protein [Aquimarina aquimarini]|uniref:hypothetical protein n=1 Tax=Aquimarina aquimarini TaxID=1191734 RepID=UPI00131F312E|nr:hypothetical protein [Aquimarina aquimarini]